MRRPHRPALSRTRVAVLGAGIMGASTALHLTRLGADVIVIDRAAAPFQGASRWNEGKIHLGYLYSADPTLRTAATMIPAGLDFAGQVAALTNARLETATAPADDIYLVHRDSVVPADAMADYFDRVTRAVRSSPAAPDYLVDVSAASVRALDPDELRSIADPSAVVAGFEVPERSVNTNTVADAYVVALEGDERIEVVLGESVVGVDRPDRDLSRGWYVRTAGGRHGPFDAVVNALWEGRPAVDRSVGHHPDTAPQHRFRVSLFVETDRPIDVPSAVIAVGPYGDVKNYDDRSFSLSWYPTGLLARNESLDPPREPRPSADDEAEIAASVFANLRQLLPWVAEIEAAASTVNVRGGWVYSQGQGSLDDPMATVHRRDLLGVTSVGTYHSVDTGKYSVAPTLAEGIARRIVDAG